MTLQDISAEGLEKLKSLASNKELRELIQSRIDDIKRIEWSLPVVDDKDKVRLARAQGMVDSWASFLDLPNSIDGEVKLREQEKEREQHAKTIAR